MIAGLLLSISIIGANYVNSPALIILFMCIAFFGNGLHLLPGCLYQRLRPNILLGLTGGVFNFIGGLAAVFIPVIIGYLAKDGNFTNAIIFVGVLGIVGALCYIFLVGKPERIEVKN